MEMVVLEELALAIATGVLLLSLALHLRPGHTGRQNAQHRFRVLQECGLGILTGGVVALAALAVPSLIDRVVGLDRTDFIEQMVQLKPLSAVLILVLLCFDRGQWPGNRPATFAAALIPWLLVPEWRDQGAERVPAEHLGLLSALLYRVVLSGARLADISSNARDLAIDATGDGMLVVDTNGVLIDGNSEGRSVFDRLARPATDPKTEKPIGPPRLPERVHKLLSMRDAQHFSLRNASEEVFEFWLSAAGRGQGASMGRALIVRDVTDQRRDEKRLLKLAHYDSLTGLANRRLFVQNLQRALKDGPGAGRSVALLYIDLDRFKEINDTLGHDAGDELLRVISERFRGRLAAAYPPRLRGPQPPSVARLGGDEFAVIIPEPENERAVEQMSTALLEAIAEPIALCEREISSSGSIGIALFPEDGRDLETLVKHADSALYGAKRLGRNRYQRWLPEFSREADRTRAIEQELRGAIGRGELTLHYQPKIDVESSTVGGFEALLRWTNRELGSVSPNEFIPIAEERGLIERIGAWCLEAACLQLSEWRSEGLVPVPVAVNVSSAQFVGSNLQNRVTRLLHKHDLPPALLEIELTERLLLEDDEQTHRCLSDLKEMGVTISLDDFGTGYSALTYLNRFPLNVVKMDRGLLEDISINETAEGISAAVISMCHSLGMKVVAEGVDCETQLDLLREMRCDQIQGFLFAPALSREAARTYLARAGEPKPIVEPKPGISARVAPPRTDVTQDIEDIEDIEEEWEAEVLEIEDRSRFPQPVALLIDPSGALEGTEVRLRHLGVAVQPSPMNQDSGEPIPAPEGGYAVVVAASDANLRLVSSLVQRLDSAEGCTPPELLFIGREADEAQKAAMRQAGGSWFLPTPYSDTELRFFVRSSMPLEHGASVRQEARVPIETMAWIRFRSQRDVGVVSSLSRKGAFVEMSEPLEPGSSCKIDFELPVGRVSAFATVAYRVENKPDNPGICNGGIGVSFYGLDPATEFAIAELVESCAAKYSL